MARVCRRVYIKGGNAKSTTKACGKNDDWDTFTRSKVKVLPPGKVTSKTFYTLVAKKACRFPDDEVFVFLTHSGTRNGKSKKYKFPTDFEGACKDLVERYSNVRICAVFCQKKGQYKLVLEYYGFDPIKVQRRKENDWS